MQTLEFTRQALERSTKAVTMRPAVGQYTHKNTASITNGTHCHVQDKHFEILTDVPPSIGGNGGAPTPGALVRSALTSCTAIGIKLWAARANIDIDYLEVRLEGDVDARGEMGVDDDIAAGFLGLRLIIFVRSDAPRKEIEAIINQSKKYSPLFDIFSRDQNIQTTLDFDHAHTNTNTEEGVFGHA